MGHKPVSQVYGVSPEKSSTVYQTESWVEYGLYA